jgi:hypothetical protein
VGRRSGVGAIVAVHPPSVALENHAAGERVEGEAVREHVASIFRCRPDLRFRTRRLARAGARASSASGPRTPSHSPTPGRSRFAAEPTEARLEREDVDVYSDSTAILRRLGVL